MDDIIKTIIPYFEKRADCTIFVPQTYDNSCAVMSLAMYLAWSNPLQYAWLIQFPLIANKKGKKYHYRLPSLGY
jgi:hypothetical protein